VWRGAARHSTNYLTTMFTTRFYPMLNTCQSVESAWTKLMYYGGFPDAQSEPSLGILKAQADSKQSLVSCCQLNGLKECTLSFPSEPPLAIASLDDLGEDRESAQGKFLSSHLTVDHDSCKCVRMCVHVRMRICLAVCACVYACMHVCMCAYVHVCKCVLASVCACACMCICGCVSVGVGV